LKRGFADKDRRAPAVLNFTVGDGYDDGVGGMSHDGQSEGRDALTSG
jgi:hypothetical protein